MKKYYNKDGKFGVLVSYGYGAGWSTWNEMKPHDGDFIKFLFENNFIEIVEEKYKLIKDFDEKLIKEKCNEITKENYTCIFGLKNCCIEWLEEGTLFKISEYDGAESIELKENDEWLN